MNPTHTQRPLAGPLRARINRLAHLLALHHETRLKASLLEQVQNARDGGASFDELAALVAKLEAAPPGGVGGASKSDASASWKTLCISRAENPAPLERIKP